MECFIFLLVVCGFIVGGFADLEEALDLLGGGLELPLELLLLLPEGSGFGLAGLECVLEGGELVLLFLVLVEEVVVLLDEDVFDVVLELGDVEGGGFELVAKGCDGRVLA